MPEFRWRLADDDGGQGALFEEEVERHVGRGEFRGMEFLHVRAGRLVNEVPKASVVPFRWTINAYRGCSHACTYCLEGSTPVLLAGGGTKPIAELAAGDLVYGTTRLGQYRRLTPTPVLDHWSTVRRAWRISLVDGTELVAGGDHRFLTERGWRYVTGGRPGGRRRLHLTPGIRLVGTGGFAPAPDHDADYQLGYLCGMIRGDGRLGRYGRLGPGEAADAAGRSRVVDLEGLRRARGYLLDADVRTDEFAFSAAADGAPEAAVRIEARGSVAVIETLSARPTVPSPGWAKGFLASIHDATGSYRGGILRISSADPVMVGHALDALRTLGFRHAVEPRAGGMHDVRIIGGLAEHMRFFQTVDPAIARERDLTGGAVTAADHLAVRAVDPLATEMPLYDITTGTGDFVADGVVSHNCFARPTHEYLGLNTGDDFDRRIVVKVNAVERVRAELAPGRWAGDHIAMGTNTDPYQRCEGKYHLTRGILGELAAAANPFSVLTKSTLILRDLDLLAEAATRTTVRANFSIGTLDEEVWRATEPGTPHPLRRVEAVARLNQAGVPCGVLVAPVLPGLSDAPEQLEAVVKACVEAGARSISPLLLHLRPGVREHYLDWLAGARPELLDRYRALYPKSYAPRRTQDELSALVRDMVTRHRGRGAGPRQAVAAPSPARRRTPAPPASHQLGLGV